MVLKRRQDGFVGKDGHRGGRLYLHAAGIACSALMDGPDGAASTLKIVGHVTSRFADRITMRPPVRRPHRES
jgi:hypothetical protein